MLGATETTTKPEVAPVGTVNTIDVLLHWLIVTGVPFSRTRLEPCTLPRFDPVTDTCSPTAPVVDERDVMAGAGAPVELIETLSKVAVSKQPELLPVAVNPM